MELHSLASYPTKFKQTVISPTKICIQFDEVQIKLRPNDSADFLKRMHDNTQALPIRTDGQLGDHTHDQLSRAPNIQTLAVGCQMPTIEALQFALLEAYKIYKQTHTQTYTDTYNKSFQEFLEQTYNALGQIVNG